MGKPKKTNGSIADRAVAKGAKKQAFTYADDSPVITSYADRTVARLHWDGSSVQMKVEEPGFAEALATMVQQRTPAQVQKRFAEILEDTDSPLKEAVTSFLKEEGDVAK